MEKAFSIATSAGLPLQCSFSGVLSPGAKGGLKYSFSDVSVVGDDLLVLKESSVWTLNLF